VRGKEVDLAGGHATDLAIDQDHIGDVVRGLGHAEIGR
jgi:hypothetical protein